MNKKIKNIFYTIILLIAALSLFYISEKNIKENKGNIENCEGVSYINNTAITISPWPRYGKKGNKTYWIEYVGFSGMTPLCKEIRDADTKTFESLGIGYAKDKNNVYYYQNSGGMVKEADPETFGLLNSDPYNYRYWKDKNNVYLFGYKINNSDPETFERVSSYYAMDKNNFYEYHKTIENESEIEKIKKEYLP